VFRYHSARYHLAVENPNGVTRGVARIALDDRPLEGGGREIPLADDARSHVIAVTLG
jgi:cyclic beta-1,2-glucan synthetase